jgi:hypothetical protein
MIIEKKKEKPFHRCKYFIFVEKKDHSDKVFRRGRLNVLKLWSFIGNIQLNQRPNIKKLSLNWGYCGMLLVGHHKY